MKAEEAKPSASVAQRLVDAWRAEIEATAVYTLLVKREKDARRADILRRMAEGEEGHRRRLEARMTELGIPIPDPKSVRLSAWQELQARVAPVERLLAAREAAETLDIQERYTTPTGDSQTDELLASIRVEEESHAHAIRDLQQGKTRSII